jgi:cysteine sulfinate desulfinase/cysteine desulfurase-like protein
MQAPKRKRSEHYVNNKDFLDAIVVYKINLREAAQKEIPDIKLNGPDISDNRLPNNINISFKGEGQWL